VLQVVSQDYAVWTTNTTNVYADTGVTASITPSATNSKVFVMVTINGVHKRSGDVNNSLELKILRGATQLTIAHDIGYTGISEAGYPGSFSMNYLDSPNTTSSTTYKVQFRNEVNASAVDVQIGSSTSSITLFEIGA